MRAKLILGICGGSGAGKHRVIHHHLMPLFKNDAVILEHDWYYHELDYLFKHQNVSNRDDINYDRPDAYENDLLVDDITKLRNGEDIRVYPYIKGIGLRQKEPLLISPKPIVIVDGMFVFSVPKLVKCMDICAYIHADDHVRLQRRVKRDLSFSSKEESIGRFYRDVMPAHKEFVEPSKNISDYVIINNINGEASVGIEALISEIEKRLFNL